MNPEAVALALVALVALATVVGIVLRATAGRVRRATDGTVIRARELPGVRGLGRGATLLQFSTEVCAPCTTTRRVLGGVAEAVSGVTHVDLDVTHRPDLASKFHIMSTPTTLILDRRGVVRARIGGAPRTADLRAELDRILAAA
ncbi:MAG: thioredoxin family protein [Pseudolysinimonas sp.]|uniref:TlpA family protein disulfide reductase n=1 Tax=Pseudolysinimonas sp. TaxID=2680009 RepID=UPI0032655D2D